MMFKYQVKGRRVINGSTEQVVCEIPSSHAFPHAIALRIAAALNIWEEKRDSHVAADPKLAVIE